MFLFTLNFQESALQEATEQHQELDLTFVWYVVVNSHLLFLNQNAKWIRGTERTVES